jgi:hypothetical protein
MSVTVLTPSQQVHILKKELQEAHLLISALIKLAGGSVRIPDQWLERVDLHAEIVREEGFLSGATILRLKHHDS